MSPGDLLTLFGGSAGGTALVFCILFITNQIYSRGSYRDMQREKEAQVAEAREERDEWKRAAELERQRADSAIATGRIVRDVMSALKSASEELR